MKSVLLSGYYGFDNSGDDAILKAIVKDLREVNKDLDITVLSYNPEKTESMYPVKAVNRFNFRDVVCSIKECSLFISGGGSLLQDVTSTRSLLYYLTVMFFAKIFKRKVMVYANGIGPINKKLNRFFTRTILNKVDLITLRDNRSKEYLDIMGVTNKNIHVTADPVYTLEPAADSIIDNIFLDEKIPKEKPLIGVSIREWEKAKGLETNIAKAIDYMIKEYNATIVLIPMHYPEDLNIGKDILELVKEDGCYILKKKYNVEEIMGIIKEMDMIIAMRLHSLIYAATQSIPMVGLIYDPKITGLLESIGLAYMCDVEDLNIDDLITNIDNVWNNKDSIKKDISNNSNTLKNLALMNVKLAYDILR
ncbi:MAG: polysaccharide pyruvyl transferase CsaB [Tissierellia bacterium]|nr:polysaccharide pyruvyl transferase CsaB [Tissierellia bacterium]